MTNKNLNLYFQGKGSNFGDVVNRDIFTRLFGCNVVLTRPYTADCMAIGSILEKILYDTNISPLARKNLRKTFYSTLSKNRPIHILGSGFIKDVRDTYPVLKFFRPVNVVALRGQLTKEIMEEITGKQLDAVPLGDPGILVSEFIKGERIEKKYEMGVVPHRVDKQSDLLDAFRQREDICILDIEADPNDFLRNMAACKTIASSSLHGLVAADSLKIPNLWIKLSSNLMGENFKFFDYYSAYGITPEVTDLREIDRLAVTPEFITDRYKISETLVGQIKSSLDNVFRAFISANQAETN